METVFIYGFPSLLILLSLIFASLATVKHIQGNRTEFMNNTISSGISFTVGALLIVKMWL